MTTMVTTGEVPAGKLPVLITFMEMAKRPEGTARPMPEGVHGPVLARHCTLAYYRFLYDTIGEPWLWEIRRRMDQGELARMLADPQVEVHVIHVDGMPAGFVELDWRLLPADGTVAIDYLGLMPWAIGRGLGSWLLDWAVRRVWERPRVRRLTINTCSFDHPAALPLYQRAGFRRLRQERKFVDDPRRAGVLPLGAAPHIPLARPAPPAPPHAPATPDGAPSQAGDPSRRPMAFRPTAGSP
ncbi:GNAT family N-acetyltransferase [Nitrospirillum viridazoti]|uniref:GNAT family N-acetyltransferase n=1 Tax=Nitrospirillum viridazoti TaxID=3144925 RepID=UPI0011ACD588|nr:GNAT family N-acetyltransferase [Nitrospirillum amazonense]TWB38728.1 acetyltransferase (GNAT) family protein [Nitrospirillum amazonense]